ncbi:MAG TPA: NADPH-dependent assimilatory sulfite reductase hemoprotein subunit [Pirellulales bacterium]|jgi:sulfite reductase (ferredoxin)|nr:NADPH-dependent assimilatory sulfite reductase hemoprotein subunit [Pirellulales bacterium]
MAEHTPISEKLSAAESVKLNSHYLRGTIAQELAEPSDKFNKDNSALLKFHGTYQQDDREHRVKQEGGKSLRQYIFMVRSAVPGGRLTADQLLGELALCDELGNGTLRITSRQGLQLHGVPKRNLHETIQRINQIKLSTLAACGDVKRNVMCCPAPHYSDPVHAELQALADRLVEQFTPKTRAYHEIWLRDTATGEEQYLGGSETNGHHHAGAHSGNGQTEVEPIYGPTYLPRKFKFAVGLPGDNCVDLYANDVGLMAICHDWKIVGYNVLVGGSMGCTPSATKTFPAIAKRMAFVEPHEVIDVCTAIVKVQRDYGNRVDRKVARLKYLLANQGLDWFQAKVEEYYGHKLKPLDPEDVWGFNDHMGWHEQGDGRMFYGLNIENGRIKDDENIQLKTALREVCDTLRPSFRLTAHQSILFCDLAPEVRGQLEEILRRHHVPLSEEISNVRRWSMACVAYPTCGLAVTESERALPGMIDLLEVELSKLGLAKENFTLRMTGCPNGCARPYNCDIGLVGKTVGKYTVFVGGRLLGDRMNFIYKDLVSAEEVVPTLVPLFVYFKHDRQPEETFGDFCHRKGADDLRAWTDQYTAQTATA